jgi:cytochrome P450
MTDTAPIFNPFEPGFVEDPYHQYRSLRESDPVHHNPFGAWMVFRYEDVQRFLRDPELSVEDRNAHPTALSELAREVIGDQVEFGNQAMLNRDPPDHTRLRRLVSKAFTPRTIEKLRPRVQELVDSILDQARERGEMELIGEFAFPLPFQVVSEMLGTPETDAAQLREWTGTLVRSLEPVPDPELLAAIGEAGTQMRALTAEIISWKRKNPADDLLSGLIAAEENGDMLSDDELVDQVMLIYIAGHETTVNLIGNGTLALLRNHEQFELLADDPSLNANLVDELLRYDSPVQMSRRITLKEVELRGKVIEPGAFVVLALASANRDPEHFGENSERLELARPDAKDHLSFGGGHHYCLGAALAKLEGNVAIGSLVRRFPHIAMAAEPEYNGRLNLRGLARLALTVR